MPSRIPRPIVSCSFQLPEICAGVETGWSGGVGMSVVYTIATPLVAVTGSRVGRVAGNG